MFLYQDAVFIGQVYGRDDKKIETDTLNLKGTGGVFRHEYTEDFWKSYDEKDTRRDATFLEYYTKKNKEGLAASCRKLSVLSIQIITVFTIPISLSIVMLMLC